MREDTEGGALRRLVPIVVAAAVAITAALAVLASTADGQTAAKPPSGTPMPRYYVTVGSGVSGQPLRAVVRDSATGRVTGVVTIPAPGVAFAPASVAGGGDGRTFVVGVSKSGQAGYSLYRLRLSPVGAPGPLAPLRVLPIGSAAGGLPARAEVTGISLSRDDTKLAVSIEHFEPSVDTVQPWAELDVVDLATGHVRAWVSKVVGYWAGPPSWADGTTKVAFTWWRVTWIVAPRVAQHVVGVREIDTADRRAAMPGTPVNVPVAGLRSAVFASGAPIAVMSFCSAGGGATTASIAELAGQRVRVLHTQTRRSTDPALLSQCDVLSVDATGRHALVQGFEFGRIDNGVFTPLPGAAPVSAAW